MPKLRFAIGAAALRLLLLVAALTGCQTTHYQPITPAGGFGEMELDGNIWRIRFSHNSFTTRETAQSYWLYRAAELTLSKGYDGFEILSQRGRARSSGDALSTSGPLVMEGEIRMLKKPFESVPPKIYNAQALRVVLNPYVAGARIEAMAASSKIETSPSPSTAAPSTAAPSTADGLKLKAMDWPATKPAPAAVAKQRSAPAASVGPALKPMGPCEIKPVMTDQDLVNCGARPR